MTSDKSINYDRLDALAEDFVARYRRGDRPSLTEFTTRHPELADEIRDLFPALAMIEQARPPVSDPSGGSENDRPTTLERLGEYRILREVGRGGMGIVYEAEQESLERHVALKVLPTHALLEPRHLQRFRREARAAARLHHTNIVPVFGVGEFDGLNYYVMQFIQGLGLDEVLVELKRLRRSRTSRELAGRTAAARHAFDDRATDTYGEQIATGLLSGEFQAASGQSTHDPIVTHGEARPPVVAETPDGVSSDVYLPGQDKSSSPSDGGSEYWLGVARVGAQVADALAYANSEGVLHRDIKPSNLLLDVKGNVWVTDFGLAKVFPSGGSSGGDAHDADLTRTGDVVGTLRYLAPERLKGESDQRGDIYSLGATLYELLTLRPPFEESDRSLLVRQVLHDEPIRPRARDPAIPLDLETIVIKAMAKEKADRYRSPAELADDLRRFLTDRPIHARRATILERTWRLCRRNSVITSLAAAIVVLAALLASGALVAGWIRSERNLAVKNLVRAERAEKDSRNNLDRARQLEREAMIRNHLTQAIVQRKRRDTGHRVRGLREIDQALTLKPSVEVRVALRNELIANLAHDDLAPTKSWKCPQGALDVDPAFERYARGTRDGVISIRRIADNQELLRLQRPTPPDRRVTLKFSPNGQYLASFTFDHQLIVWELEHGHEVLNDAGCAWDLAFDFTSDSRSIVSGHDKEVLVYDLATAAIKSRWPTEFAAWCVSCSPDVDRVAISPESSEPHHKLQIFACSTGKLVAELDAKDWVFDIAWHPNGKTIAFGSGDTNIYLWDVGQPRPYRKWAGAGGQGIIVEFSHDGNLLASCRWGGGLMLWDFRTGELLCSAQLSVQCVRFSPDDRRLGLFRDGPEVGIYELIRSPFFRYVLRDDHSEVESLINGAFSPDGRLLAVGTETGLGLWDFATGRKLASAPIGRVDFLQFVDTGDLLTRSSAVDRWRIRTDGATSGRMTFGPPEKIPVEAVEFCTSGDGRVLVAAQWDGAMVVHVARPDQSVHLGPHDDCRFVSITRDGRWVATGSHFESKVKVWDSVTGDLVATLPVETGSEVRFSPDGRWLATTGGGIRLWQVGSWEEGHAVNGGNICSFSPDGRILASNKRNGSVRLIDPDTAREYAELEHPKGCTSERYIFSPDGTALVAVCTSKLSGFAWDLRGIREELSARGLDWELPPYPPRESKPVPSLAEVELVLAEPDSK